MRATSPRDGGRNVADPITRGEIESQFLASLQHSAMAQMIDAGHTGDGRPFWFMGHVDGLPMDAYAGGLDVEQIPLDASSMECDHKSDA